MHTSGTPNSTHTAPAPAAFAVVQTLQEPASWKSRRRRRCAPNCRTRTANRKANDRVEAPNTCWMLVTLGCTPAVQCLSPATAATHGSAAGAAPPAVLRASNESAPQATQCLTSRYPINRFIKPAALDKSTDTSVAWHLWLLKLRVGMKRGCPGALPCCAARPTWIGVISRLLHGNQQ